MAQDHQQQLLDALPATGEIEYGALHRQLQSTGQGSALNQFHRMRRSGAISVRTGEDGKLYVARPAGTPPAAPVG